MSVLSVDFVRRSLAEMYWHITGRKCSVDLFVVRKDSALGWYYVHPHDSGEFYLVCVKKIGEQCLKAINS